jgi:hypothetical protein
MLKIVFLFFISLITYNKPLHPLYVGITDIEWNNKEQTLEIVSKIFIDDLEATLKKNYTGTIDLYEAPNENVKKLLADYFKKHLLIAIDDKPGNLNIIGYEKQKEACWVYFEVIGVPSAKKINIINNLLHDYTNKQINLMHVTVGSATKSYKLDYPQSKVDFLF